VRISYRCGRFSNRDSIAYAYGGLVQFCKEISLEYVLVLDRGNFYYEKGRYCSTGRSIGIVRRYYRGGNWCLIAFPLRVTPTLRIHEKETTWETHA